MKSLRCILIIAFLALYPAISVFAFPENNLSSTLNGKILLDTANNGEAWYIYPGDFHRYFLGTPTDAYTIMRNLSLGISNSDFEKIKNNVPDRFKGLILLKVEEVGRAYYVNPGDKSLIYMADGTDAFRIMRQFSLGITAADLKTIPTSKLKLNISGQEISREWQYLGWWGVINKNYTPAMTEPKLNSLKLGNLAITNKIKVLSIKKGDGRVWYKIDGGQYPGAYIDSTFVDAIAQPNVQKTIVVPDKVKSGEYWVDVNLTKKIMTLYKYDQVMMATYISTGMKESPTITGAYNVWLKLIKTRMKGAPPLATHVYDLPDVPWVMYYKGSYSIHGTYWHDDFGTQRSAGCTNATIGDSKYIFDMTSPKIGNATSIRPTTDNPGMIVNNHY